SRWRGPGHALLPERPAGAVPQARIIRGVFRSRLRCRCLRRVRARGRDARSALSRPVPRSRREASIRTERVGHVGPVGQGSEALCRRRAQAKQVDGKRGCPMTWADENRAWRELAARHWSPRSPEPLRLRAWLASPIAWDGYDPLTIEGALQYVVIG